MNLEGLQIVARPRNHWEALDLGLLIARTVFPSVFRALGVGPTPLPSSVVLLGFGISALLAVGVAVWPAWSARRLTIAEAISAH